MEYLYFLIFTKLSLFKVICLFIEHTDPQQPHKLVNSSDLLQIMKMNVIEAKDTAYADTLLLIIKRFYLHTKFIAVHCYHGVKIG
jgi:hypothetical protein